MVHIGQVISVLGGTSEARTVARWMAASGVVPKGMAGRGASTDLSHRDVAMIVLGMAAPVARRAPEYASELAQLVGDGDGQTLVDILADALSDHEHVKVVEMWLPNYEGGISRNVKLKEYIEGQDFKDRIFYDARSHEERGHVLIEKIKITWCDSKGKVLDTEAVAERWQSAVEGPPIERWVKVDGFLLALLAKLFVEREGAAMPVAVAEDTAA